MDEAVKKAVEVTKKTCILSPAAASYNTYKNFEERGKHYKSLLKFIQNNMNTQL
jgi:UDP-N-acetylmuramoylalanine--D-glutamate ligase